MSAARAGYSSERSVLIMIVASLTVIACMIGLLVVHQKNDREEQIRARGIGLARLLAGLPSDDLIDDETYQSMLQLVHFSQGTEDFAYAALIDGSGAPIAEVTAPGVIVPPVTLSNEPSAWVGEREMTLTTDQRPVMEYHAPVFESGDLAGQIRLGYVRPGYGLLYEQIPVAATLALLVFLLTPLAYYLLKREIRPIATAGAELERLLKDNETHQAALAPTPPLVAFMDRFNQFVDYAQARIQELESDRGELVASAKLISYKKSRIEMVLQTLPEAVLILDAHGKVTYANERVTTLLGASRDDVVSRHPREWCANPEVIDFLARYETSTASRYMTDTFQFRPTEQSNRALALNGYPLFEPNSSSDIHGTLVVVRDITQEMLARESRSEFVAHLGHELKTPLNTLALYSEALLDYHEMDDAERIDAINIIRDEIERLIGLVNNLLSMTRIEMGSLDLQKQRVRLADLLSDITENIGRLANENRISIELDIPRDLSPLSVDKDLLRVSINNLMTNAVKYNKPGGSVTVAAEETDEAILIRVRDTGIGITAKDCESIFEKFYRSDSSEVRERTGHGLGLALARQIVELHEGELSVESERGKGSTFTITLWRRSGLVKKAI
jgi:PAS domain S-box-containing protein